jgi:hypothetical protein
MSGANNGQGAGDQKPIGRAARHRREARSGGMRN